MPKLKKGSKEAKKWAQEMQARKRYKRGEIDGAGFLDVMRKIGRSFGKPFEKLPVQVNPFELGYQGGLKLGAEIKKAM
jgi:hypothetical protein